MTSTLPQALTLRQQQQLGLYRQGGLALARSRRPLEARATATAIAAAYRALGYPAPEIRYCASPATLGSGAPLDMTLDEMAQGEMARAERVSAERVLAPVHPRTMDLRAVNLRAVNPQAMNPQAIAGRALGRQARNNLRQGSQAPEPTAWGAPLRPQFEAYRETFERAIEEQLSWPLQMTLEERLRYDLLEPPYSWQLLEHLYCTRPQLRSLLPQLIAPELWLEGLVAAAFAMEVVGLAGDLGAWRVLSGLLQHCGWILPYEQICWVCDRPRELRFNGQGQLHGEGEAAVSFADDLGLYAHNGIRLPLHYGQLHPSQWQPRWLAEEPDPLLRQALITGIGEGRLAQELPTISLDCWQDLTLLELALPQGDEPLLLLKRHCPRTLTTLFARVPSYVRSAQAAACWVKVMQA